MENISRKGKNLSSGCRAGCHGQYQFAAAGQSDLPPHAFLSFGLHASGQYFVPTPALSRLKPTGAPRILVHNTCNAAGNTPIRLDGQSDLLADSQRCEPIERAPDDLIRAGLYSAVLDRKTVFPAEHGSENAVGIFKRSHREGADGRTPSAAGEGSCIQ